MLRADGVLFGGEKKGGVCEEPLQCTNKIPYKHTSFLFLCFLEETNKNSRVDQNLSVLIAA